MFKALFTTVTLVWITLLLYKALLATVTEIRITLLTTVTVVWITLLLYKAIVATVTEIRITLLCVRVLHRGIQIQLHRVITITNARYNLCLPQVGRHRFLKRVRNSGPLDLVVTGFLSKTIPHQPRLRTRCSIRLRRAN
ncbi:hypothetical protein HanIR_Chr14g0723681 [Helianthus annuus]|nr:hypothetical protein HanIR_Chr14g0723681 [Helianthus annuus]